MDTPGRRRFRRFRRRLVLASLGTLLLFEGLVRAVLFHGWLTALEPVAELRSPLAFAGRWEDELYELAHRTGIGRLSPPPAEDHDPLLGWRPPGIGPDWSHPRGSELAGQRPVLLFGAPFAAGPDPGRRCEELFETTPHGPSMELLSYASEGYGLDQIRLLAARALPGWVRYDPLVLIALPVHDVFDRCALSIRDAPKPRYRMIAGEPALESAHVPALDEHLRSAFPWYRCWGWRLILHSGVLDSLQEGLSADIAGVEATELELAELDRRLLLDLVGELGELGLRFGFVVLCDLGSLEDPLALGWREQLVFEVLNGENVPYALIRGRLEQEVLRTGRPAADFFLAGEQQDRFSALGEQLVLGEVAGLAGRLIVGAPPYVPPPESIALQRFEDPVLPTRYSAVQYLKGKRLLVVRAGKGEPTELRFQVGDNTRLHFRASCPSSADEPEGEPDLGGEGEPAPAPAPGGEGEPEGEPGGADAELSVLADGRAIAALRLERGAPPQTLELDAQGARVLVLRFANVGNEPWQVVHLSAVDPIQ